MTKPNWRATPDDIAAIVEARHGDPFALLGPHDTQAGAVIRALVPGAQTVEVETPDGVTVAPLERIHPDGFFEGLTPLSPRAPYRLAASNTEAVWRFADP